jgi:hypothetical protein
MPLFYKDDQSVKEEVWFPPKCRTESFDREANGWNLRHTELFVDDWTSEASMVSWNGSQAGTSPQCDGLVELKYHAREDVRRVSTSLRHSFKEFSEYLRLRLVVC